MHQHREPLRRGVTSSRQKIFIPAAEAVSEFTINCAGPIFDYWAQSVASPSVSGQPSEDQAENYKLWLVEQVQIRLKQPLYVKEGEDSEPQFNQAELPALLLALGLDLPGTPDTLDVDIETKLKDSVKLKAAMVSLPGIKGQLNQQSDPRYWVHFLGAGSDSMAKLYVSDQFAAWLTFNFAACDTLLNNLGAMFTKKPRALVRSRFYLQEIVYGVFVDQWKVPLIDGSKTVSNINEYLMVAQALVNYVRYSQSSGFGEFNNSEDWSINLCLNKLHDFAVSQTALQALDAALQQFSAALASCEDWPDISAVEAALTPLMARHADELGVLPEVKADVSNLVSFRTPVPTPVAESVDKPADALSKNHVVVTTADAGEAAVPHQTMVAPLPKAAQQTYPVAQIVNQTTYWAWRLMLLIGLALAVTGLIVFDQGLLAAWSPASLYVGAAAIALMILLPLFKLATLAFAPMATVVDEGVPVAGSDKLGPGTAPVATPVAERAPQAGASPTAASA